MRKQKQTKEGKENKGKKENGGVRVFRSITCFREDPEPRDPPWGKLFTLSAQTQAAGPGYIGEYIITVSI